MELVLLIPLFILCWIAWQAYKIQQVHGKLILENNIITLNDRERRHNQLITILETLQSEPVDLSPIVKAINTLPEPFPPQDLTPLVQAVVDSKPEPSPPVDLSEITTAILHITAAYKDSQVLLAPVLDRLLPQLHTINTMVDDLNIRVSDGPGRRTLRLS